MYMKEAVVNNQVGLHARPATFFIQKANEFKSSIWVEKDERRVNAKSLLGVLSLGIVKGTSINLIADGPDEKEAVEAGKPGALRIVDTKGFIKVQRARGMALRTTVANYEAAVAQLWDDMAVYQSEVILRPDFYVCMGARVMDFSSTEFDQLKLLMGIELNTLEPDAEVLIVAANMRQS